MDFVQLFTSMEGRISRSRFWIGVLIFVVASIILSFVLGSIMGASLLSGFSGISADGTVDADAIMQMTQKSAWFSLIMFLVFLWPGASLLIKRRHDRGSSGMDVWIFYGLEAIVILIQVLGVGYSMQEIGDVMIPVPNLLMSGLGAVTAIFGLYLLVVCGFLKGDDGANAYGPDPLGAS